MNDCDHLIGQTMDIDASEGFVSVSSAPGAIASHRDGGEDFIVHFHAFNFCPHCGVDVTSEAAQFQAAITNE
jgi:hypothetical protein